MAGTYTSWLHLSVDHVIPLPMRSAGYPVEWLNDITNCVTCCRACNEFLNQYQVGDPPPTTLDAFFDLRDRHFPRNELARERHEVEMVWFRDRSGLSVTDNTEWLMRRVDRGRQIGRAAAARRPASVRREAAVPAARRACDVSATGATRTVDMSCSCSPQTA
jgi:hypothetical protein